MLRIRKNDDLIYYHNKILNYIRQEKGNIHQYEQNCFKLAFDCYNSLDIYGVLDEDKQFIISQIENYKTEGISCPDKKLSYKDFKENIKEIKKINNHIVFIQYQDILYSVNINDIIKNYKKLIQTSTKQSFIGKTKIEGTDEQQTCIEEFIQCVKQMFPESILTEIFKDVKDELDTKSGKETKKEKNRRTCINTVKTGSHYCSSCENELTGSVCENCGSVETENFDSETTYDDTTRINVNKQFKYEKRCHFRDTINQYQGKQNKHIPAHVYDSLYEAIEKEGLLDRKAETRLDRYRKVKKSHIREFLKATNNSNHYEDIQLIYSKITGKDCPCITQYEKQLYEDFDSLTTAFLNIPDIKTKRDNFLNSHYVLRQLLLKQGVKVPDEDLNYLKTPTRLREHDEIYKKCCFILNWNFTAIA